MSTRKFDSVMFAVVVSVVILIAAASLVSVYAARQGSLFMAALTDELTDAKPRGAAWTTLRDGAVLGRSVPRKGPAAYVVVARKSGGEYRAVASVDDDGSILRVRPIGDANGSVASKRLGVLFEGAMKDGADTGSSPLDAALEPLIVDTLETITMLERSRMEALDAKR